MTRLWLVLVVMLPMAQLRAHTGNSNKPVGNETASPIASGLGYLLRKKKRFRWATPSRLRIEIEVQRLSKSLSLPVLFAEYSSAHVPEIASYCELEIGFRVSITREKELGKPHRIGPLIRVSVPSFPSIAGTHGRVVPCCTRAREPNLLHPTKHSCFPGLRMTEASAPQPLSRRRSYSPPTRALICLRSAQVNRRAQKNVAVMSHEAARE
jgi:hypothetical protein